MKYTCIPAAHTVVSLCKQHGIRQVVISPGSRNAPLILGFTGDPFFECFSIVDERSAAFFALGLSQQSGIATVLVCTSGSALLNYYPAISEAFYSRIPLLVVSADRPPYKIDIGDGQTIRQDGVFQRHIGFQANLRQDLNHAGHKIQRAAEEAPLGSEQRNIGQGDRQQYNESQVRQAIETAQLRQLPAHINVPLEEPLYNVQETPPVAPEPGRLSSTDTLPEIPGDSARIWRDAGRVMVLAGVMPPGMLPKEYLEALAKDPSVLVFTESTSNLEHPEFFPSIDSILAPIEHLADSGPVWEKLRPELLITMGGMVVSKKIKQFLRKYPPERHWHIDPLRAYDTFYCLERHIKSSPKAFFETVLSGSSPGEGSDYRAYWASVRHAYTNKRQEYLHKVPFSDFTAFHEIMKALPADWNIQLANSSTVRYAQLFDRKPEQHIYSNRGTSGIEGSTSTAVGAAWNAERPTILISGDLSFLYDGNALWNTYVRDDFRIIVIHNSGGGIFRILPGFAENETFATFFETVHHRSARYLCEMHGVKYQKADSRASLEEALGDFFEPCGSPALLEIETPRELNNKILLDYFEYLS